MTEYISELSNVITLVGKHNEPLFQHQQDGFDVDVYRVEWSVKLPYVVTHGWCKRIGGLFHDRRWESETLFADLNEDIQVALKQALIPKYRSFSALVAAMADMTVEELNAVGGVQE